MRNRIYLDHAATTPLAAEVLQEMMPCLTGIYGNPSSIHGNGREARQALENARKRTAAAIGARPQEIYFTSGGSESDNWAIRGIAAANRSRGRHLITDAIEHHAVLHSFRQLEQEGFEVTYLRPDGQGRVSPEAVEQALRPDTILISVMTANNEIGTVQPIREIGSIARARGILFHTDAVQAVGAIPVDVREMNADLLSLSAHKFQGPKGVGALYVRQGTKIDPLIQGGAQERSLRAGTENVAGIVGLGCAIARAVGNLAENAARTAALRDRLIQGILAKVPETMLNGDPVGRLPGNAHFTFRDVDGEALLMRLDLMGIAASGGSACTAGAPEPSHVLTALGQPETLSKGSLRMTLGPENTEEEIDEVLRVLPELISDLRRG